MSKVILGLPKGSLQESTYELMRRAGFSISGGSRSYFPRTDDPELDLRLLRPQEMSRYVESGHLDAGITGHDWIYENSSNVVEVAELIYSKVSRRPVRWVLAVPEASDIQSVKDLEGLRIATEAVGITERYLKENGVKATVEFSWGATEVKCPELVDAIVDITETGSSLRANNLRIVDTLLESTTRLVANKAAWADDFKREKLEQLSMLIQGALMANQKVLLKLNIPESGLKAATDVIPALHAPTVNKLSDSGWFSIESVVDEREVRTIIPKLKSAGAEGIIEVALNKIVP